MIMWMVFCLFSIPWSILIIIPYIITGKDYISRTGEIYESLLKKKPKEYRKKPYIDPKTGQIEYPDYPLTFQKEYWLGQRPGEPEIDKLNK